MPIKFEIQGAPRGKGRPRFSKIGQFVKAYTDDKTANYEDRVIWEYIHAAKEKVFDCAVRMDITVYHEVPKSTSKKNAALMLSGELLPIKKPDADNIAKIIADALNGIAYHDDTQIVMLTVEKRYAEMPTTIVEISEHKGKVI